MDYNKENMIEFISGQRTATVSFTNRRHINRIKKLYEEKKMNSNILQKIKMGLYVPKFL